jgi:predicted nucleic acid-binding protein
VDSYLLDTSALSVLIYAGHVQHANIAGRIQSLGNAPIYVSAVALAELEYGFLLAERAFGAPLADADRMIREARNYPRLDVTQHTAAAYAELKAKVAMHHLPRVTRGFGRKPIEDWVSQFTGKALCIDDNDLWICAQAREMNFVVVANDRMQRIREADQQLKFMPVP